MIKNTINFWLTKQSRLSLAVIADVFLLIWSFLTPAPVFYTVNGIVLVIFPESIESIFSITINMTLFIVLWWGLYKQNIYIVEIVTKIIIVGLVFIGSIIFFEGGINITRFAGLYYSIALLLYLLLNADNIRHYFLYRMDELSTRELD